MRRLLIVAVTTLLVGCVSTGPYEAYYPESSEDGAPLTVEERNWVWFFSFPNKDERWQEIDGKAREQLPPGTELANVDIESNWSVLSLLMYFGLIGFVEETVITGEAVDENSVRYEFTEDEREAIKLNAVFVGMSRNAALLSLGAPDRINRTTTENSVSEQWVYEGYQQYGDEMYIYVRNGTVKTIQD